MTSSKNRTTNRPTDGRTVITAGAICSACRLTVRCRVYIDGPLPRCPRCQEDSLVILRVYRPKTDLSFLSRAEP